MADARRAPLLVLAALLVIGGAVASYPHPTSAAGPAATGVSAAPAVALSSSWSCAGATAGPHSAVPGQLVLANAGPARVSGVVDLVSSDGHSQRVAVAVPAGGETTVDEDFSGAAPGAWVGALVTLYGGMASVSQQISSRWGQATQPCASSASGTWYFPFGMDLRNAGEYISLVNPYPSDAIVDLSFTTELGREEPGAFEGITVPADGMTVIGLPTALRPRTRIATTVHARSGGIVAFETELVTKPPKHGQLLGTPGALNPVAPEAGVTLTLGASGPEADLWWPQGREGGGVTESYDIYNPGGRMARATLSLLTQGTSSATAAAVGGSDKVTVPAYGWVQVTTNQQPWAISGAAYAVHLVSTNRVGLVAERSVVAVAPPVERGLGAMLGLAQPARRWILPAWVGGYGQRTVGPRLATSRLALTVQVSNPGAEPATVEVQTRTSAGALGPVAGLNTIVLGSGQRTSFSLPALLAGHTVVLRGSSPVLVEENSAWRSPVYGLNLAPAVTVPGPG